MIKAVVISECAEHGDLIIVDDHYVPSKVITTEVEADIRDHPEFLEQVYDPLCGYFV